MLRDLIENEGKSAFGGFKTASTGTFATGMGVVKNDSDSTAKLPSAETGVGICLLQKSPYATGVATAQTEFSDYDPMFNTYENGENCILNTYGAFEKFGTDQFDTATVKADNAGKYLAVGTDGKWKVSASGTKSLYVLRGLIADAGHTLAVIEKTEVEGSNA